MRRPPATSSTGYFPYRSMTCRRTILGFFLLRIQRATLKQNSRCKSLMHRIAPPTNLLRYLHGYQQHRHNER